jgi:hypothetical protein
VLNLIFDLRKEHRLRESEKRALSKNGGRKEKNTGRIYNWK